MKAKEYYEKYKDRFKKDLNDDEFRDVTEELYEEFYMEGYDIIKARGCKSDKATISVIREQNDKANSLMRMFEKDFGVAPLKTNWYITIVSQQLGVDCTAKH